MITRGKWILGAAGTAVAVILILRVVDWRALAHALGQLSPAVLFAAAAASVLTTLLLALRWAVLAGSKPGSDAHQAFRDALVGQSFNAITPAAMGADAYRVAVAGGTPGGRAHATGLVVLERLIGVSAFAIAYLCSFAVATMVTDLPHVFAAAAFAFIVPAVLPLVLLVLAASHREEFVARILPRRLAWLATAIGAIEVLTPARLAAVLGLSIAGAVSWLLCVGILASGAGVALSPATTAGAAIITEFARLLPISIQGIGVREATFAWLVAQAGGASAAAVVACGTAYALHFALVVLIAVVERIECAARMSSRVGAGRTQR
jgi:uncharacterized membrane protein YbhN (UPF0104 family)